MVNLSKKKIANNMLQIRIIAIIRCVRTIAQLVKFEGSTDSTRKDRYELVQR